MKPPLSGIKVLDLSRVLAGPYCAQVFADLGADVIKVEKKSGGEIVGDDTRKWGPPYVENTEPPLSAYFACTNRSKRSMAIDFDDPKDLDHIKKLVSETDILIENFKVDALKKFGLDFKSLQLINPKLIYCSITGFGQTGPYKSRPGYDALIQAMGGIMSVTGEENGPPVRVGVAVSDLVTGLYAAIASLSALIERATSKKGQHIDLALMDVQVSWLANIAMNFLCTGDVPKPMGSAHPNIVPYQAFKCADKYLFLAIGNDGQFEKFATALGADWASRDDFQTNEKRVLNRKKLIPLIEKTLVEKPRQFWLELFENVGLPAGPVNDFDDLITDPQVIHRGLFSKTNPEDHTTSIPTIKSPMIFSRSPLVDPGSPPLEPSTERLEFLSSQTD